MDGPTIFRDMPQGRLAAAVVISLLLLSPAATGLAVASPDQSDPALREAKQIIGTHKLLTPEESRCSTLVFRGMNGKVIAQVGVLERHGDGCAGDPDTAPRRFDLEIDMKTGAAKWDRNYPDMEMRPVPR